ncbi:propionyl-CoA synthetase [Fulvimarina sp. 2208YS6-2-32]|uniref:Propionyl-CoA synthetase n=1 Tax=Fulvimarina uroteuthidis TaxID=3098149 RepID=A0ABU5I4W1_9HYPH|nr:propionyl-CoA synthetase [Fulvimarina sp. 2208YS6-2-32]MDY8110432.1 propionyl-CoA synthetase [Fulvimarina sp. 2208YS6-2-32]
MARNFRELYQASKDDRESFWLKQAEAIDWFEAPTRAFDETQGVYGRWFPDAVCNTCHNAVDRHVLAGHGDRLAIIYDSPLTGSKQAITYGELLTDVKALAAAMLDLGIVRGDRVVIYMPMVPETAVAMLACARIGAIHSVVFGGFAAHELAKRIDDAEPKLILSASCGVEPNRTVEYKPLLDKAFDIAVRKPAHAIVLQRPERPCDLVEGRDHDWADLRERYRQEIADGRAVPCARVKATDPLYILYTSGTTGKPKGVIRDNGGHLVAMHWSMGNVYGIEPGDVSFTASDVGWVVGHSYIVYAPLIKGATTILFEGKPVGTPDAGTFWRIISEHGAKLLFTAPTAIRAVRKEDPDGKLFQRYDMANFEALYLAGERADPETVKWAERVLRRPVIDHWWQTETGWAIAGNPRGIELLPVKHGSPSVAMPGYDLAILDTDGTELPAGEMGAIAIRLPLAPGNLPTLWGADDRFRDGYLTAYPGYYATSDAGYLDEEGYLFVMGRTDDVINVAGHRLSTGEMEEIVARHPAVVECAVIGMEDAMKGELPCGFVVLKDTDQHTLDTLEADIVRMVRDQIGPVAAFKRVIVVDKLPKTRSGKVLRRTMKSIVDDKSFETPATIEDASAIEAIEKAVRR